MYKYSLISSSKKTICPSCGKRRFVNYVDVETRELLPSHVGRCDREVNCGYHLTPKQYFENNKIEVQVFSKVIEIPKKETSHHPLEYVSKSVIGVDNFTSFMISIFSLEQVKKIIKRYNIGTSKYWINSTIFWQIDNHNKVRAGKVILYDKIGHRSKYATWIHSILIKKKIIEEFQLDQCLFGLHLINESQYPVASPVADQLCASCSPVALPVASPVATAYANIKLTNNKAVAIVESEKTACIMSEVYPSYIWMATGGSNNISDKYFEPLKDYKIIMFPDLSKDDVVFDKWNDKVIHLKKYGFDISISNLLQNNATDQDKIDGLDIADYYLCKKAFKEVVVSTKINDFSGGKSLSRVKSISEKNLEILSEKNPDLTTFIDALDLTLAN